MDSFKDIGLNTEQARMLNWCIGRLMSFYPKATPEEIFSDDSKGC